jgi:hypothetical protein
MDVKALKQKLASAGVEIYRTRPNEIHVAERVRLHIMDSGIRLEVGEQMAVLFTARVQRSDFGNGVADEVLFERVRDAVGTLASARGYTETTSQRTEIKDPVDEARVLDVWYEVAYAKRDLDPDQALDEVQWALQVERFVAPA